MAEGGTSTELPLEIDRRRMEFFFSKTFRDLDCVSGVAARMRGKVESCGVVRSRRTTSCGMAAGGGAAVGDAFSGVSVVCRALPLIDGVLFAIGASSERIEVQGRTRWPSPFSISAGRAPCSFRGGRGGASAGPPLGAVAAGSSEVDGDTSTGDSLLELGAAVASGLKMSRYVNPEALFDPK